MYKLWNLDRLYYIIYFKVLVFITLRIFVDAPQVVVSINNNIFFEYKRKESRTRPYLASRRFHVLHVEPTGFESGFCFANCIEFECKTSKNGRK